MSDYYDREDVRSVLHDLDRFVRDVNFGTAGDAAEVVLRSANLTLRLDAAEKWLDAVVGGRCSECRHWKQRNAVEDDEWRINEPDGSPERRREYERWGACANGKTVNGAPKDTSSLVRAEDSEHYSARLLTADNFGCVQWDRKP